MKFQLTIVIFRIWLCFGSNVVVMVFKLVVCLLCDVIKESAKSMITIGRFSNNHCWYFANTVVVGVSCLFT